MYLCTGLIFLLLILYHSLSVLPVDVHDFYVFRHTINYCNSTCIWKQVSFSSFLFNIPFVWSSFTIVYNSFLFFNAGLFFNIVYVFSSSLSNFSISFLYLSFERIIVPLHLSAEHITTVHHSFFPLLGCFSIFVQGHCIFLMVILPRSSSTSFLNTCTCLLSLILQPHRKVRPLGLFNEGLEIG